MLHAAAALWTAEAKGKVAVIGSATMLSDAWLTQADNAHFADWLFQWLTAVGPPCITARQLCSQGNSPGLCDLISLVWGVQTVAFVHIDCDEQKPSR